MQPPLTYYAVNVVAALAILGGIYLIFSGLPSEPTWEERKMVADNLLAQAQALAAGRSINGIGPTQAGRPADFLIIALGFQAIFVGILLAGFGTIIDLLHKISRR